MRERDIKLSSLQNSMLKNICKFKPMETSVHFLHIFSKCTSYTHWKKKGLQRYFKLISNSLFSNTIQTFYCIRNHIEFHMFWFSHVNDSIHKFSSHLKSTVSYYSTCKKDSIHLQFCIMQERLMREIWSLVLYHAWNNYEKFDPQFGIMQHMWQKSISDL